MRILFASANFGERIVGGAQLSVRLVAEQLVRDAHEVGVTFVDPGPDAAAISTAMRVFPLHPHNVYWHRAPRPGALKRLVWHGVDRFGDLLQTAFGRVLDEFRPDVVHTNVLSGLTTAAWKAADARAIPIVHTIHDYYLLCANSGMRCRAGNCDRPCLPCRAFSSPSRRAAKLVSGVIYVSQHMRASHENERVFATDAFVTEIIGSYVRKQPISRLPYEGPLRLGFLGRLAPDKGLDGLLDELRQLDVQSYSLKVGGTGAADYEAQLRQRARGMPVEFLGRVEPDGFFDAIDVLVVPSLWNEPAGRVVFEAGLSRVPVVVAARGGLPQMVGFGQRGWTYEPERHGELARTVRTIVSDRESARLRVARWAEAAAEFSPENVTARTLHAYDEARVVRARRAARAEARGL